VDATLGLVAGDADRADLAGVGDMRPAIGLQVEAHDLDRPDLVDPLGQEVDPGPDEVRDGEGLVSRQDRHADVSPRDELVVDLRLDLVDEIATQPLEFKVHPARARLHVAAGDERTVVAPHDAAQGVERGVRPHEQEATRPVQLGGEDIVEHVDDARVCLSNILQAISFGAACCNYTRLRAFLVQQGTLCGAVAEDVLTGRTVEILIEAGILPDGALQLIVGSTGDLLDRLGPQDVLAFTGSADTARYLRSRPNLLAANTRINIEADSLNAAVLGPDVDVASSPTFALFVKDVLREMTQKTGQKCTAVRRILVPADRLDTVREALIGKLREVVTGNPADPSVTMGPLATAGQLADAIAGIAEIASCARLVQGTGQRVDGVGSPAGKGYFVQPTLLVAEDARNAIPVHRKEVFGPVATLLPYDTRAEDAAEIAALGGGTLVNSVYSDDAGWVGDFLGHGGGATGRVYIGSETSAAEAPGSGAALPQALHGGPGRAGGGEELGGLVGVRLYLQRVAVQGSKTFVSNLAGDSGAIP